MIIVNRNCWNTARYRWRMKYIHKYSLEQKTVNIMNGFFFYFLFILYIKELYQYVCTYFFFIKNIVIFPVSYI